MIQTRLTFAKELIKPLHESRLKQRATVRFPDTREELETIRQHACMTEEQIHSAWMDSNEFEALRAAARKLSRDNMDKGYSRLLCPIDNPKLAQLRLDLWVKPDNEQNMRGLERYVNSEHRQLRDESVRQTVRAVLEAQSMVRERGAGGEVDFMDWLASISRCHSAECIEFAQMIAKADERAAQKRNTTRRVQHRER
eukprot:scaffold1638_cov120-Cylindrotheca_fusiformis.AAC.4